MAFNGIYRSAAALSLCCCLGGACGGGGGLDEQSVRNIPPGDARGSAASGRYAVRTIVLSCSGQCTVQTRLGSAGLCDVGYRDNNSADVVQEDGRLRVDIERSYFPSRLEGGLDADGSYLVGG